MSRKNGDKKRKAAQRPRRKRKADQPRIPPGHSTAVMKHFAFENPFAGLSDAQKRELMAAVGETAAKQFRDLLDKLQAEIKNHDPVELLSTAAFYCLLNGSGPDKDFAEGPYTQSIIEVLQSICLRFKLDEFGSTPVLHQYMFRILDIAKACFEEFGKKRFMSIRTTDSSAQKLLSTIEGARLHTQVMRNWGYPQHMRHIIKGLFKPLEADFQETIGIGPIALLDLLNAIRKRTLQLASEFRATLRDAFHAEDVPSMVRAFCDLTGGSDKDFDATLKAMESRKGTLQEKRWFLLSYFHQQLPGLFIFTAEECAAMVGDASAATRLVSLFDKLSIRFGDFASDNPEHALMQSRIRTAPLIQLDEGEFFLPIWELTLSFFIEMVEALAKPYPTLKDRYHERRSAYLEEELAKILKEAFPGAIVQTGTTGINPIDKKNYENDCLVVIGPIALVLEAKSERVRDSAKRGGMDLKDVYATLVREPAEQAERFARLLEEGEGLTTFTTKKHGQYQLDLSSIRRAVCISVTLDSLPATTLCWRHLIAVGLAQSERRPAINLSLADLMVVLEVLATPLIRLHYFWRRIQWEESVEYLGDELDLLVYYLSEGLSVPKATEQLPVPSLFCYGSSTELHRHYMAVQIDPNTSTPRPKRLLTQWWGALIEKVELGQKPERWDIGAILLDVNFEGQEEFEQGFATVVDRVRKEGNQCSPNAIVRCDIRTESKGAIVGFAYRQLSHQDRNGLAHDLAAQALAEDEIERVVIIGCDIDRMGSPYDFIAISGSGLSPQNAAGGSR